MGVAINLTGGCCCCGTGVENHRKEPPGRVLRPTQGPVSTPASALAFSKLLVTFLFKAPTKGSPYTQHSDLEAAVPTATGVTAALPRLSFFH